MQADTIADLKRFNKKADWLLNSTFADAMLRNDSGFIFEWKKNKGVDTLLIGAEGESVDAVLLTLRMFIQNNDRISIHNIAELYSLEPQLHPFKQEFDTLRTKLNTYLDTKNDIVFFGKNYTHREIIELLLFGDKGHSNRVKDNELHEIMSSPPFISNLFLNKVNAAIAIFIKFIFALSEINNKALSENN